MNDKELLELAAKAAGINQGCRWSEITKTWIGDDSTTNEFWNPLTSDGDALRLAVKLGMQMYIWQPNDGIGAHYTEINRYAKEKHGDSPYAATRRAIVRAAAEIGRNME